MYNERIKELSKDDFKLVELDDKIIDQKFEGKPRSSFRDAMVRFGKNKTNVIAFFIVAIMIMLSIFVPVLTTKDHTSSVVRNVQNLAPRIPGLEKLGIADGTSKVSDISVDYNKIDPETGLYLPSGTTYDPQYIKKGSLINNTRLSTTKDPTTLHGQNVIYLENFPAATVRSNELLNYTNADKFKINIQAIEAGSILSIYIDENSSGTISDDALLLGEITDADAYTFDISANMSGYITFVYENLNFNINKKANVEIVDIEVLDNDSSQKAYYEGYTLSQFKIASIENQGGRYERINGEYTTASFSYYKYNQIFADVNDYLPGRSSSTVKGFFEYLEDYPELKTEFEPYMQIIEDGIPTSGENLIEINYRFEASGVPIREVKAVRVSYNIFIDEVTYTFDVMLDGAYYNGFESIPYFWFGTDKDGRDLFAQIWLSLRTSLFLGLIVSIINIVVGVIYGAIEGYYGGKVDFIMERFADYVASFPGLTILTIIYLNYGPGLMLLLIYLTYSGWIGTASTTRIQFYRHRGREYVLASKSMGASDRRLIFKHILPNAIGILITRSILSIPSMIFTEASLSFLGFGIGRGVTLDYGLFKMPGLSLGVILQEGQGAMLIPGRFYQLLIPSVVIIILMISFNMFGNALRDAFNPTLRGNEEWVK